MKEDSLKNRTVKGVVWSFVDSFGSKVLSFVFTIFVARILTPSDYGIIAMPAVFIALAQVFIDSGFTGALIRRQVVDDNDLNTAFYFNVIVGVFSYTLLFLFSPLIADFYNVPLLEELLRITAIALLMNPLCAVQHVLLSRMMDFKSLTIISMSASVLSGIIALIIALQGFGVWALVWQQVTMYGIRACLLWYFSSWRPKLIWSSASFKYLWGFGSKILGAGLLDTGYNQLIPLLVGKFYAPSDLGNYTRASHFSELPSSILTQVIQKVTFPALSKIQDDEKKLVDSYREMMRITAFVIFPCMLMLCALASPLVKLVLTEKWMGCVLFLQILCFTRMWYPIHAMNLNLLQVKGRSDLFLRLEVWKKLIGLIALCITLPMGLTYFVLSSLITSFISLFINTYYTGKIYGLSLIVQMKDLLPLFFLSTFMCIVVLIMNTFIENEYFKLLGGGILGAIIYIAGAKLLKLHVLYEMLNILYRKSN